MSLFHSYNNEDVLIRAVIAGILDVLNNKIQYRQIWGDEDKETISVPWYYNQSGDERFMQDFYTHYGHCLPPKPVDGNFDFIPRGVLTYTGSVIDEQRITSRFVQGRYVKDIDGVLEQYVSYLYSIPLSIRFDAELWIDNQLTAFKIEQEIREVLFKNITYYVYYKGMRIGCTAGFPADVTIDKNIAYSFESDNKIKLNFSIEVESYQPVFDPTTEMLASNKMTGIGVRLYSVPEKSDGVITATSPGDNLTIPKGIPLWLDWIYNKEGAIISNINLYWLYHQQNERNLIERGIPNHEWHIWNIPETFTNFKEPVIIWEEDPSVISVLRNPVIKIIPNTTTNAITESSFTAYETGYFITSQEDASINLLLEMKDDDGNISYSPDGKIWANVKFNQIDAANPVSIASDVSIIFPGTVDYKEIDIHIANSVNTDVFGIINKLKIV
jgi:hypothetical protein